MSKLPPFAEALKESGLRPVDFCRAVEKLTGQPFSPVMSSRWNRGFCAAPAPAIALAVLLGRVPEEERKALTQGPPRKKYTYKEKGESSS